MTSIITNQLIQEIENNQEWQEKFDRQVELEEKMRGMGVDRHWSEVAKARERGQETSTRSVRRLMNSSVAKIAEGIRQFIESCESGKAGRKHSAYPLLKQIEPESAALITARVVLDGVAKGDLLVPLARRVASLIEDELAFREFAKADKKTYDWLVKREKRVNGSSYRRQRLTMLHNMEARNIAWQEWTARESLLVGSKLIEIMTETTGLIQKVTRTVDVKRQEVAIEATPEA